MLRYYEAEGLLTPGRTAAGYRAYGPDDEAAVRQIRTLGAAGLTLAVIREFLPCTLDRRGAFEPCDELITTLREQIEHVDEHMANLAQSRAQLDEILDRLLASIPRSPN